MFGTFDIEICVDYEFEFEKQYTMHYWVCLCLQSACLSQYGNQVNFQIQI